MFSSRSAKRSTAASGVSGGSGGSWFGVTPVRCFLALAAVLLLLTIAIYLSMHPVTPTTSGRETVLMQPVTTARGVAVPPAEQKPLPPKLRSQPQLSETTTATSTSSTADSGSGGEQEQQRKHKVAVAITVTKDGPFVDGALVLGYAAQKYHSAAKGFPSPFQIDLVAFVTKKVVTAVPILRKFGWKILVKDLPVALDEIENQDYAQRMRDSGCCGADEFLKLWAYTLTEYDRVLHLDMDSIIFRNMDEMFSIDKEFLYTGDYNMKAGSPVAPAQGGFLVIRPSLARFEEFRAIIRKGDHRPGSGWGGSHIGNFWGGQTIQGIMPYFYHVLHPGDGMELNRCQYNNMVDNPYHKNTERCIDGQPTCEDCRLSDPEKVYSAHFTICQKPWTCTEHLNPKNKVVCEAFHKKWFALRDEMERDLGLDLGYRVQKTRFKDSLRMCKGYGDDKYIPVPLPATIIST